MNFGKLRNPSLALGLGIVLACLGGCGKQDPAAFVAAGKAYLQKEDSAAAIIEAKNALQKEPENVEARVLLGTALLHEGDARAAETELRKAIALHASADDAYPPLARALVAQGSFIKLVEELRDVKLQAPAARADVDVSLATAHMAQGDVANAKARIADALAAQPENPRALLAQAQLTAAGGDLEAASRIVDTGLKSSPDDLDLLIAKSEIEFRFGRKDESAKLLDRAIAAHPDALSARSKRLSLAVQGGNLEIAKEQLARMKEKHARDYVTVYADALVAFASRDYPRARDTVQRVLAANPNHVPSLLLSGLVNFQLGSYAASEDALQRVVARAPGEHVARRTLATIYLRTGRVPLALQTLEPALRGTMNDPTLLRVAGEAYLASGNVKEATRAYERANAMDKENLPSQVRLAQVRLAAGDTNRAFGDLEALASKDESANQADMALFTAHLKRKQYDQALAVADAIEKKQPKSGMASNLRGAVYLAKRDLANARKSFEKALEIEPGFAAAASNLATIDIQEGHPRAALERYEKLLAKDPSNERWLLAYAELQRVTGAEPDKVRATIQKAIAAHPSAVMPRVALVAQLMRQDDKKAAVAAAQEAQNAIPNDPRLVETLASALLASGDTNQAVETLKRLVRLVPQNPLAFVRLAEAQVALKDYQGARASTEKALAIKDDLPQAWLMLARIHLDSGRPDAALAEARKLQKSHPDKAVGYALEGEILMAQKKPADAAKAYSAGLTKQPSPSLAVREYAALEAAGKTADASVLAARWTKEHAQDPTMPLFLAQQAQKRNDLAAARTGYARVLELDDDNVVALNNMAWILGEAKDPKAVEYAERAHRASPMNPSVLDTFGWVLVRNGDASRGVQLLRMASAMQPGNGEIRLHLAKALAETGDKAAARRELDRLTKLDKASPVRAEAEKLLTTL